MRSIVDPWMRAAVLACVVAGGVVAAQAPVALRTSTGGDQSASVGLPDGWKVVQIAGGALDASAPNGAEAVHLGFREHVYDTAIGSSREAAVEASRAGIAYVMCQHGTDLATAYRCVLQQRRKNDHLQPVTLHVGTYHPVPAAGDETSAIVMQTGVYVNGSRGPVTATVRVGTTAMDAAGNWILTVSGVTAAPGEVERERATLQAITASYRRGGKTLPGADELVREMLLARPADLPNAHDVSPPRE